MGQRGKGIRGFRKITDCIVEPISLTGQWDEPAKIFAAEEVSVKKNIRLHELSDSELMDLMGSMGDTDIKSAEEFDKFKADLSSIHSEISSRGINNSAAIAPTEVKEAHTSMKGIEPVASAGFTVGKSGVAMGFVGGLLVGMVGTMYYYKSRMDSINADLEQINKQLNEAESAIKRAESREEKKQAAESAVRKFDSRMSLDSAFLQNYNRNMGPSA